MGSKSSMEAPSIASAVKPTSVPEVCFVGFEIERREAGTEAWSVALHQGYDPRSSAATAAVCDPLPGDGRTYEYRARSYDGADNYSPAGAIRTVTVAAG